MHTCMYACTYAYTCAEIHIYVCMPLIELRRILAEQDASLAGIKATLTDSREV